MIPKPQTTATPQTLRLCYNWFFFFFLPLQIHTTHLLNRTHGLRNWRNSCINRSSALWLPVGFGQWEAQARNGEEGRGSLTFIPWLSPGSFTVATIRGASPQNYLLWILITIFFFLWLSTDVLVSFFFLFIVVGFVIHWNETAMGLHVFPIPIPPLTSLSTRSL